MNDKLLQSSNIEDIILWIELTYSKNPMLIEDRNLTKGKVRSIGYRGKSCFYKVGNCHVYIGYGKICLSVYDKENYTYIPDYETTKTEI